MFSRTGFLETLEDTLNFTPKVRCCISILFFAGLYFAHLVLESSQVDFNAGVVAAGDAQIESTVTGNAASLFSSSEANSALTDQTQIYLPINNALTKVG